MTKKPKPESEMREVYCFGGRGARELIERIDEYRWSRRMPSRAATIRALLENGLWHVERQGGSSRSSKGESSSR